MTALARHAVSPAAVVVAGTAGAVLARVATGAPRVAASLPAAGLFGLLLITLGIAAGWRPGRLRVRAAGAGIAGGAVLVAIPAIVHGIPPTVHAGGAGSLPIAWAACLALVVAGEEIVLRGVLFSAITADHGVAAAVIATSVLFGLIHVPLYGWAAVPLDVAAGIWLAALRVATGGVAAPALAHLGADLAAWWVP